VREMIKIHCREDESVMVTSAGAASQHNCPCRGRKRAAAAEVMFIRHEGGLQSAERFPQEAGLWDRKPGRTDDDGTSPPGLAESPQFPNQP
jgi:hypothetical protein